QAEANRGGERVGQLPFSQAVVGDVLGTVVLGEDARRMGAEEQQQSEDQGGHAGFSGRVVRGASAPGAAAAGGAASQTTASPMRSTPPIRTRAATPPWPRIAL